MKTPLTFAILTSLLLSTTAHAAPVGAFSELIMNHYYSINSGNKPDGIKIAALPDALVIESGATSFVDAPTATETVISSVQIGDMYADPPVPFIGTRIHSTQLNGGLEGASSSLNREILIESDPDADVEFSNAVRQTVSTEGAASAILLDDSIAASAGSYARYVRGYSFLNTTDSLISFNIAGSFDAYLRAEYIGDNGIARVAGGMDLLFSELAGAQVNFFPVSPYFHTTQDDAVGASVSENLIINEDFLTGIRFNASATAIGSGGTTSAIFDGSQSYVFGITLDPGAHIWMTAAHSQANSVEHTPRLDVPAVPLPASAILLIMGIGSLLGVRRSQAT